MHRATPEKLSQDCTNLHSIARRCPPYHTIHTYLAGSSPPGSSAGTHRNNLRSRSSLPVRFQSLPPLRSSYQLQVAAATLYPTQKAVPGSLSLPVWAQIQNPIPQLCSIPDRLGAYKRRQRGAPQNGALALSTMRKTPLHRTSLRPRPDGSALAKARLLPSRPELLPAILPERPHPSRCVVAGGLDER
jgi:hypothetical protein